MKVPKYIKEKAARLDRLCYEANCLRVEIERWMEKNGVDTDECYDNFIFDDSSGVGHTIDIGSLEEYVPDKQ